MSRLDEPAYPTGNGMTPYKPGLTIRERACIDLRIPESGNDELDALIRKARRQEIAAMALFANGVSCFEPKNAVPRAIEYTDALIAELDKVEVKP